MPTILLIFSIFISLWILSRVIAWSIQWYLKRRLNIDVKIGKVGLFSFKNVQLSFAQGLTVEIESLWLSSSYVNHNVKKAFGICVNDIRIQTPVPTNQQRLHTPKVKVKCRTNVNDDAVTASRNSIANQNKTNIQNQEISLDKSKQNTQIRDNLLDDTQNEPDEEEYMENRAVSLEEISESADQYDGDLPFARYQTIISTIMTYAQFVGLYLENVTVVLLRSFNPSYLILLKTDEISLEFTLHYDSYQAHLDVNTSCCRVLRTMSEEDANSQCQAELQVALNIDASLDRHTPPSIQTIQIEIDKPKMMLTEGFLNDFRCNWVDASRSPTQKHTRLRKPNRLEDVVKFLPSKGANFRVSDLRVEIVRETKQRTVNISLASLQVGLDNEMVGDEYHISTILNLNEFTAHSAQVKFAALNKFHIKFKLSDSMAHLESDVSQVFFHYHHEEIQYWSSVIRRLLDRHKSPDTPSQPLRGRSGGGSHHLMLLHHKLRLAIKIDDASFMVSTAACPGLSCGIVHTQLTCSVTPRFNETSITWPQSHDLTLELELNTLYARLADITIPHTQLSGKRHYWGYLLYTTIVLFKVRKIGQELKIEGMMDNIQAESSSLIQSVCLQLLSAFMKSRPVTTGLPAKTSETTLLDFVTSDLLLTVTLNVSNFNVFVCFDDTVYCMSRVDGITCESRLKHLICSISGVRAIQGNHVRKCTTIQKSQDILNPFASAEGIRLKYNITKNELNIQLMKDVSLTWNTQLHMILYSAAQDIRDIAHKFHSEPAQHVPSQKSPPETPPLALSVIVSGKLNLGATLSHTHRVSLVTEGLTMAHADSILVEVNKLLFVCDDHDIFTFTSVMMNNEPNQQLKSDRKSFTELSTVNRSWSISADTATAHFPYQYKFCGCQEQISNIWKWIKLVHKIQRKPFTIDSPLPPDLYFRVKEFEFQLCDDPFEVMLSDNYELLKDEWTENEKRREVLDQKMASQKQRHGILPVEKVAEVYESLARRTAEIYIQRSKQLYAERAMRTKQFTWSMQNLVVTALSDLSLHGKDNCVRHIIEIDKQSPYPTEGLEFTNLWCRMVKVASDAITVTLRDYPQPMLKVKDFNLWGCLVAAEQVAPKQAIRSEVISVGQPWGDVSVVRMMSPLKFYHDFSCDVTSMSITYGPCWEPAMAQFNHSLEYINKPSVDPSHPMPWWDKSRLKYHGRLTMSVKRFSYLYHASLDPYNTSELMDWTWTNFLLDWTNC